MVFMGRRTAARRLLGVLFALALVGLGWAPWGATLAFAVALLNAAAIVLRPGVGIRPARIGLRQLAISVVFYGLLVWAFGF